MSVPSDRNNSRKVIEKLSKYKELEIETTRMWGMRTETVPVIVALGLIRERMDQNLGKIPGASNINELQKIILLGTAHTKKVSVHQIKNSPGTSGPRIGPSCGRVFEAINSIENVYNNNNINKNNINNNSNNNNTYEVLCLPENAHGYDG